MKTNSIWMMTAAMAAMLCGTAFAQGNGNNQPSGQAGGTGATNVVVTNTSAQAVPVTVTNQAPPPTSIAVNNTNAQPVPTKDRSGIGFDPFSATIITSMAPGASSSSGTIPIPSGKRVVIEYVSAWANGMTGGEATYVSLSGYCNGQKIQAIIPSQSPKAGFEITSAPVKVCFDILSYPSAGTVMWRTADNNNTYTGTVFGSISLSGYIVDIP